MTSSPVPIRDQVRLWGPESDVRLDERESIAYCRALAGGHYENFSVLSSLVPSSLRDDFAAVYGFCRWSDDLADEIGDRNESRALLQWWRRELDDCIDGHPRHPVMCALSATIQRHDLPARPFHDLIDAFDQDQEFTLPFADVPKIACSESCAVRDVWQQKDSIVQASSLSMHLGCGEGPGD